MKSKIAFALLAFSLAPQAFAAGAESHGGQAVFCTGKDPVTLDYYQATLPTLGGGAPDLVDIAQTNEDGIKLLVKSRLDHSNVWYPYYRAMKVLGEPSTWLQANLVPVADSEPAFTLPEGCALKQVAIRQDNTMYVNGDAFKQLSPAQQGILQLHEALYYVSQQNGFDSSVQVREVIRNLLLKTPDAVALSMAVHEMGSKFFWWEGLSGPNFSAPLEPGKLPAEVDFIYDPMLDGMNMLYQVTLPRDSGHPSSQIQGYVACKDDYKTCPATAADSPCGFSNINIAEPGGMIAFDMICTGLTEVFHMEGKMQ